MRFRFVRFPGKCSDVISENLSMHLVGSRSSFGSQRANFRFRVSVAMRFAGYRLGAEPVCTLRLGCGAQVFGWARWTVRFRGFPAALFWEEESDTEIKRVESLRCAARQAVPGLFRRSCQAALPATVTQLVVALFASRYSEFPLTAVAFPLFVFPPGGSTQWLPLSEYGFAQGLRVFGPVSDFASFPGTRCAAGLRASGLSASTIAGCVRRRGRS